MGLSTTHLIIFLVIIVLVFGTKKLKNIGSDLGSAVKGFKDGVKDGDKPAAEADTLDNLKALMKPVQLPTEQGRFAFDEET